MTVRYSRRRGGLAGALVMSGVLLQGCVSASEGGGSTSATEDPDPGPIIFDLTEPPTREELGYPEGDRGVAFGRPAGEDLLDAEVLLPNGERLEIDNVFSVSSTADGPDGQPESIDIISTYADEDPARERLRTSAAVVGIDPAELGRGVAVIARAVKDSANWTYLTPDDIGYTSVTVGVRKDALDQDVTISHQFFWAEDRPPPPDGTPWSELTP